MGLLVGWLLMFGQLLGGFVARFVRRCFFGCCVLGALALVLSLDVRKREIAVSFPHRSVVGRLVAWFLVCRLVGWSVVCRWLPLRPARVSLGGLWCPWGALWEPKRASEGPFVTPKWRSEAPLGTQKGPQMTRGDVKVKKDDSR